MSPEEEPSGNIRALVEQATLDYDQFIEAVELKLAEALIDDLKNIITAAIASDRDQHSATVRSLQRLYDLLQARKDGLGSFWSVQQLVMEYLKEGRYPDTKEFELSEFPRMLELLRLALQGKCPVPQEDKHNRSNPPSDLEKWQPLDDDYLVVLHLLSETERCEMIKKTIAELVKEAPTEGTLKVGQQEEVVSVTWLGLRLQRIFKNRYRKMPSPKPYFSFPLLGKRMAFLLVERQELVHINEINVIKLTRANTSSFVRRQDLQSFLENLFGITENDVVK